MFEPAHWLPIAEACASPLDGCDPEASRRTAINRAYYAPLLMIKARVDALLGAGTVPAEGTHGAILLALRKSRIREFQKVLEKLKVLQELRENADYVLSGPPLDALQVDGAVARSRWLVKNLLPAIPDRKYRRLKFAR